MVIFLYGPDGYRLKENVDIIVGSYRKKNKNGMSYYRFDMSDNNSFDDLSNAVKSISFFDEAKLIIVKNLFSAGPDLLAKLSDLINNLGLTSDKKTVVVFVENSKKAELQKANKDMFSFLNAKPNLVREIEYLGGVKLSNWIRSKFKNNGHTVSPAVADLLADIVGSESWALANEINKLSNYLTGKTCHDRSCLLTQEDVELLVSRKEDNSIFDLIDAVGNKNRARAFEMMYRLTNSSQDPHYLLSMLVYHLENLLSVFDPEPSRQGGSYGAGGSAPKYLHPFVAKKAASQARRFSKEELLSKFNYLAELDVASKNGQVDLEDALYNLTLA